MPFWFSLINCFKFHVFIFCFANEILEFVAKMHLLVMVRMNKQHTHSIQLRYPSKHTFTHTLTHTKPKIKPRRFNARWENYRWVRSLHRASSQHIFHKHLPLPFLCVQKCTYWTPFIDLWTNTSLNVFNNELMNKMDILLLNIFQVLFSSLYPSNMIRTWFQFLLIDVPERIRMWSFCISKNLYRKYFVEGAGQACF